MTGRVVLIVLINIALSLIWFYISELVIPEDEVACVITFAFGYKSLILLEWWESLTNPFLPAEGDLMVLEFLIKLYSLCYVLSGGISDMTDLLKSD